MVSRVAVIAIGAVFVGLTGSACDGSPEAAKPKPTKSKPTKVAQEPDESAHDDWPGEYETELDADVDVVDIRRSNVDPAFAMAVVKIKNRGKYCPVGAVTVLFYGDDDDVFYAEGVNHFMELGKEDTAIVEVEAIGVMGDAKKAEVVEVSCQ